MRIVLIGASGFLGRYLLADLVADGHHCVVLTRAEARLGELELMPGVELVQADVYDADVLTEQFAGAGAVVSMAGILNESGGGGKGFHKAHVELVEAIIQACTRSGVSRVLHVSALKAGEGRSHYLKSKGEAENLLKDADALNVTIFQPAVIFGRGDSFFNRFGLMLQLSKVLPLACPKAQLQPVYAGDVTKVMTAALDDPMTWGETYQLGGPKIFTLKELVQWTAAQMGLKRKVIGLPNPLSAAMALSMGVVPTKPFSWDNYQSLQTPNTTSKNGFAYFGIDPRGIETVVPDYLAGTHHQKRLDDFRAQPRRQ
jgi:uncharacterized protein YbjT (DUF2867 family)